MYKYNRNFENFPSNIEGRGDQFEAGSQNHITKQRKEIARTESGFIHVTADKHLSIVFFSSSQICIKTSCIMKISDIILIVR